MIKKFLFLVLLSSFRLKHAARLLSNKEYNISEIGYMVGFNSHSYFSKCFYHQFILTPTEFLENQLNNDLACEKI